MSLRICDVIAILEEFAPLSLQEDYDNCGLQVGSYEDQVQGVLLCVDMTESVLDEALALGANLVIAHHPLIFHPLRQVVGADSTQRIVARALLAGVSIYAAHTNLDSTVGGLSFRLGELLGLTRMQLLSPHPHSVISGYGVVGDLPGEATPTLSFLHHVKQTLDCKAIRHSALCRPTITRVALSTGSGGSFIPAAIAAQADLYLSADFKYNDFFTPDGRIVVADVGHFESEYCAIALLYDVITKKIANFAVHKSEHSLNPVHYLV